MGSCGQNGDIGQGAVGSDRCYIYSVIANTEGDALPPCITLRVNWSTVPHEAGFDEISREQHLAAPHLSQTFDSINSVYRQRVRSILFVVRRNKYCIRLSLGPP